MKSDGMTPDWKSASAEDVAAIKRWFDDWGAMVAGRRFEDARDLFHADVIGFGTWMDLVEGRDELEARQWRSIWGTIIDGFIKARDGDLALWVAQCVQGLGGQG